MPREHPIFAALYDLIVAPGERFGMAKARSKLLEGLRERVLEVGAGTGLNFPYYPHDATVFAFEPDFRMLRRAIPRRDAAAAKVRLVAAEAEAMPFHSGVFDAVVATLVFCTIPDPGAALGELRRVLKPGGVLHFIEHIRAPSRRTAALQDAIDPLWRRMFAGCRPNRETLEVFRRAGFRVKLMVENSSRIVVRGEAVAD